MLPRYLLMLAVLMEFVASPSTAKPSTTKKIVLIAGPKSHEPTGNETHDYP